MQDGESAEKLPLDLLEEIAAFLPLASLCRFRVVSKEWNKFICRPDFASRHARASSPEEYVLFLESNDHYQGSLKWGWEVLDVANKRFFNLSNDFLQVEFVEQNTIFACCPRMQLRLSSSQSRFIIAADGGLLCLSYYIYHQPISPSAHLGSPISPSCELGMHEALLVCNPISKTVKQLPHFAGWSKRPQWVMMSTDRDSMEYEIYFIPCAADASQPNAVYIYQSKTTSWRASAAVPGHLNALTPRSASIILRDEIYVLFIHHDRLHIGLASYNKAKGVFSDLGIDVPCVDTVDYRSRHRLVVSNGRLFCVIINLCFNDHMTPVTSIEIVEFILSRREYIHLSVLPGQMLDWFLDNYAFIPWIPSGPAIATGLANSIFLRFCKGRSLEYNLLDRTWHKFLDTSCNFGNHHVQLLGSNHCLSLCAP